MKNKNIALVLALVSTILTASANALSKIGLEGFAPITMAFLRHFFTAVFFLVLAIIYKVKPPKWKDVWWFVLTGFSGFAFFTILFNIGLITTNVSTASIILGTFPIMTIILAAIVFKDKIPLFGYIAVAIEFIGMIVLFADQGAIVITIGAVLILLSAFLLAVYNVAQKHLLKRYRPIDIITYSIITCLIMMSFAIPETISQWKEASQRAIWAVIVLGILPSGVGTILWSLAVSKATSVTTVTNFAFLTPFISILIGLILVYEPLEPKTILGGVIVIGGSILFEYVNERHKVKIAKNNIQQVQEHDEKQAI